MDVWLRLLVPRRLKMRSGDILHETVMSFFNAKGEPLTVNAACLKLPRSFPAVLEGRVSGESYRAFLSDFPHPELLTIQACHAQPAACRAAA